MTRKSGPDQQKSSALAADPSPGEPATAAGWFFAVGCFNSFAAAKPLPQQ
jgi:hypothetical protein